jgi:hypothetical protein
MSNVDTNFSGAVNEFANAVNTMNEDAREDTYHLSCLVKVKKETRTNTNAKGEVERYEATLVYLIPNESSEQIKFWDCYLPDYITSIESELVFMNIVNARPFRGYVDVANKNVDKRHIGVMSREMIDFLSTFDGKTIRIDCLPCSEHDKYDV